MSIRKPINWIYLINSLGVFLMLVLMSLLINRGILSSGEGLFIRKAIVCSGVSYLAQVIVGQRFFHPMHFHPLLLMGWYFLFGIYKCVVFQDRRIEDEIYIGAYIAITLILAEYLINSCLYKLSLNYLLDAVKLVFLLMPVVVAIHYALTPYLADLTVTAAQLGEPGRWVACIVIIVAIFALERYLSISRYRLFIYETKFLDVGQEPRNWLFMVCCVLAAGYYPCKLLIDSKWLGKYPFILGYINEFRHFLFG